LTHNTCATGSFRFFSSFITYAYLPSMLKMMILKNSELLVGSFTVSPMSRQKPFISLYGHFAYCSSVTLFSFQSTTPNLGGEFPSPKVRKPTPHCELTTRLTTTGFAFWFYAHTTLITSSCVYGRNWCLLFTFRSFWLLD